MTNAGIRAEMFAAPEDGFDIWAPENIAPLVGYLASPDAQNISGNVFIVWGQEIAVLASTKRAGEFHVTDGGWTHESVAENLNKFFDGKEPIKDSYIVSPFE